jgi:hypothetical protein
MDEHRPAAGLTRSAFSLLRANLIGTSRLLLQICLIPSSTPRRSLLRFQWTNESKRYKKKGETKHAPATLASMGAAGFRAILC